MAAGLNRRRDAPTRLRAAGLRTVPAGAGQPFTRQVGIAALLALAAAGVIAAFQAGPGAQQEAARQAAGPAAPSPAPESKLHANPVSMAVPEQARPAPALPAPPTAAALPLASPAAPEPSARPFAALREAASPPAREEPRPAPLPRVPGANAGGSTLGEAVARGSVRQDAATPVECLPAEFKALLAEIGSRFGRVTLVSTTQLHTDNHSRGSVRARMHQACRAVDFKVEGDMRGALRYLRSRPEVSGLNTYRNDLIHIDYAERRQAARGRARAGSDSVE